MYTTPHDHDPMQNYTNMEYFRDVAKNEFVTDGPPEAIKDFLPKEYLDKMHQLSDDYSNIKWLPLDIPRIEFDDYNEFAEIWDKENTDIRRIKVDVAEPWDKDDHPMGKKSSWYQPQFKGLTLFNHPANKLEDYSFAHKKYTGDNPQIKRIVEQVFEYFPIHTMWEIFLWESVVPIGPHRDKSSYWKCPTEFRCMLHDENPDPTLYVVDVESGDKNYIAPPPDTNSFCWSNGTQIHGSDFYGRRKILLCMSGLQHSVKSRDLFDRSIAKYKDQLNYKLDL